MAAPKKIELGQEPIWELQFDETITQYRAFCLFRDLLDGRSLGKVAQRWNALEGELESEPKPKRGTAGAPLSRLALWSSANRWIERVEAYDLHLDRRIREARETELSRMARTEATLGRSMVSVALRRVVGHEDPNDPSKNVAALNPNDLSASETAMLAREGVTISRLSTNRPTSLVKGALMIHAREYEEDLTLVVQSLFVYIPDERKPMAAEWVRAFAAGEINRELTA